MILLDSVLLISFIVQGAIICIILALSAYFEYSHRSKTKKEEMLRSLFLITIRQQLPLPPLPSSLCQISVVVPILEELEQKVQGPFWEALKEEIIHNLLRNEIKHSIEKKGWISLTWALRSLNLSPKHDYQQLYLDNLKNPNTFVRNLATDGALFMKTDEAILAILHELESPQSFYKIPYVDAFLRADNDVWNMLRRIFKQTRLFPAFTILARRSGFLTPDDIRPYIHSEKHKEQWWALEALKNNPSEEGVAMLQELTRDAKPLTRIRACHILGKLRIHSLDLFASLLKDSEENVRLAAAWAYSHHEKPPESDVQKYLDAYPRRDIDRKLSILTDEEA